MRNAETVLNIIRSRGQEGLPLERMYRLLFRRDLYLRAYAKLYRNEGAMTKGVTDETADGMSLEKIDAIIEALRFERYQWRPVRRVYIPKKNGGRRPLGMPSWSDKLVQEVLRMILEAYYEPQFSPRSHGFRPGRGCHTALREIRICGKGTKWFIEGDLSACFDRIDHQLLMKILGERIHDGRFLRLIGNLLKAGHLENWTFETTYSGVPQGGIVSPILSNIVLDRLDRYVETLIPRYTKGRRRKHNLAYERLRYAVVRARKSGQEAEVLRLRQQLRNMPTQNIEDKTYRRLWYVRYADDFLLGVIGPKAKAMEIKEKLSRYLQEKLHLELNTKKTLVTHAGDGRAKFLGYEVHTFHCDTKCNARGRSINGRIGLRVPRQAIQDQSQRYLSHGKPIPLMQRIDDDPYSIIAQYQAEYAGVAQYYQLAYNRYSVSRMKWVAQSSLVSTLAKKHKMTRAQVYRRFGATITLPEGTYKVLQAVVERGPHKKPLEAHFGGIPLKWNPQAKIQEKKLYFWSGRSEIVERLLAQRCELCGSPRTIEVHHVRKLSNLNPSGDGTKARWAAMMQARKRKTLVVCQSCHKTIHAARYDSPQMSSSTSGEPCDTETVTHGSEGSR